jgi:CP family cyanate transporter-like MFS transporter
VVWVAIAGLGQGVYSFAFTMINKRTRTQSGSGILSGFAQGVGYALASVGPFLFGLLHHPGDGWLPSFGMLGAWLLVLSAGAMMVNKPRFLEDAFNLVERSTRETAAEPDCSRSHSRDVPRPGGERRATDTRTE